MGILQQVESSITKHRLLHRGDHVLVAVSGGADSVALLHVLKDLARPPGLKLTVAHMNHRIRGKAADADAAFVRKLARALKIPFVLGSRDVPRLARQKGLSLEMAAREARYAFLAGAAKSAGANVIATAHTADDQAETVLLKLARGAGPRGLSGIPRETSIRGVRVVRPMLDATRSEIEAFLREMKTAWREDKSNADVAILRNKVRHEVLPDLELKLNPRIRSALRRTADILREEDRWLDLLAAKILAACLDRRRNLDIETLRKECPAAVRRVVRLWLSAAGIPEEKIDFDSVERVERLIHAAGGTGETDITSDTTVQRRYGQLLLARRPRHAQAGRFRKVLKIPGETVVPGRGLRVVTSLKPGLVKERSARVGMTPARASFDYAAVNGKKVTVRSWKPGDRMKPLGMNGSKKIQDIFVDEKVPSNERGFAPLFECNGEIIWVPGYRVARGWEVKDAGRKALQILVESSR